MIPFILDLVIVLALGAGAWRLFSYVFWCDKCEGVSLSGSVQVDALRLCRSHALEAREPKGCPTAKK